MMKKRILQVVIVLAVFSTLAIFLIINKKMLITPIFAGKYEICGIDVSHYQGEIDWVKLSGQNLDFAFIKATEGSGHIDERFFDNWQEAAQTELFTGAYHFFSFDSDGAEQAKWYIETVGSLNGNIAPAVDVEFYGDIADNPPPKAEVIKQLGELLDVLEEHYRTKPIIYTTYTAYYTYLKDEFETYPLWIRNVYYQPLFSLGDRWALWQYTDMAVLEGYEGTEQCIDMNVFRGTEEEWEKLLVQCCVEDSLSDRSREEVFDAVEEGDFSVVMKKSSDPGRIVESLQEAYELDGDSKRTVRCDIDGDGLEELLLLIKYNLEGFERIDFILKYRNGGAVCAYYDWCDGNEWLILGEGGRLIHCLSSNNGSCYYYGMKECTLNAGGIKEIDYTGEGVEVCVVYEADDLGLWWWEGQQPPITQASVYYTRLYVPDEKGTDGSGMMNGQPKELITKEQFCAECKELTGKEFTADIAPKEMVRVVTDDDDKDAVSEVNSGEESGKWYGEWEPDLTDNDFMDAVRQAGNYEAGPINHTYRADYDGDGCEEAFVIVGEAIDMWGDASEDQISGDMWFVDRDKNAVFLQKASFAAWQEYIVQDGKTYLFVSHDIGIPWITDIYTVRDGEAVVCAEEMVHRYKHLGENGQVIEIQEEYDGGYDILDKFGWSGHTWKPYTFLFEHGELTEIPAREVTFDDVVQIAALPDSFAEKEYDAVQYILRDNGELNINTADYDAEYGYVGFGYFTYYANENGAWELMDEGPGIYRIQLTGESWWEYLERMGE